MPCRPCSAILRLFGAGEPFDGEIRKWEEKLNSIGDDAALANVDPQNILAWSWPGRLHSELAPEL